MDPYRNLTLGTIGFGKDISRTLREAFDSMCNEIENLFNCEFAIGKINEIDMNDRIHLLEDFIDMTLIRKNLYSCEMLSEWLEKTRFKTHMEVEFDENAFKEEIKKKKKLSKLQELQEEYHNISRDYDRHKKGYRKRC